jgi:hypothetical protein
VVYSQNLNFVPSSGDTGASQFGSQYKYSKT